MDSTSIDKALQHALATLDGEDAEIINFFLSASRADPADAAVLELLEGQFQNIIERVGSGAIQRCLEQHLPRVGLSLSTESQSVGESNSVVHRLVTIVVPERDE